jgi:hypothetical protein
MQLNQIVNMVNAKLAGELLTYSAMIIHLDSVIDDINAKLNSTFPAFSEFNSSIHPNYPDYNFFPDRFVRSVVILGAAFKFYTTDEEGSQSAVTYGLEYNNALFVMQRDYSNAIPTEYQALNQGYVRDTTPQYNDSTELNNIFPTTRYTEVYASGSSWNGRHLTLGNYHFWVDADREFRFKLNAPTSDTDGLQLSNTNVLDLITALQVKDTALNNLILQLRLELDALQSALSAHIMNP